MAFVNGYWLSMALPLATSVPLLAGYVGARFPRRAPFGTKAAAERAMLGKFQSPFLLDHMLREPHFSGRACPPGRRGDVPGFVRLYRGRGGAGTRVVARLLHVYADLGGAGSDAHGGVVINYMGDGVLAVFGLPSPQATTRLGHWSRSRVFTRRSPPGWRICPPAARDRLDFRIGVISARRSCCGSDRRPISRSPPPATPSMSRAGSWRWRKKQHCRVVVSEDLFAAAHRNAWIGEHRGRLFAADSSDSRPNEFPADPCSESVLNAGGAQSVATNARFPIERRPF